MATQIAPTPTIKGESARKILAEANTKRKPSSQINAAKLMQRFSSKVKHK